MAYGSGQVSGTEKIGPVSYAGATVRRQSFGAATTATGFDGVDGIIGFGPVGLTKNTVTGTGLVPTFMDNLYKQRSIVGPTVFVCERGRHFIKIVPSLISPRKSLVSTSLLSTVATLMMPMAS